MEELYSFHLRKLYATALHEGSSFVLICLYIFFEYVRPQSIYTQIDIIPWVPLLIVCIVFSLMLTSSGRSAPNLLNKLMVAYAIVVLASSTVSYYPEISFQRLRVFFDWLLFYFLIVKIVNNEKRFFLFLVVFLLCSFKMSQHGFLSWAKMGFTFSSWGVTGAPGWFRNSGEVGIQMCIYVPLSIAFILGVYRYISKKWLIFFVLMPVTGVGTAIASASRGALVGLGAAGVWSILKRPKIFILGGIFLGLIALVVYNSIPERSMKRFESSGKDVTSLHRLERWHQGMETLHEYPFLGVGFAIWDVYYPEHFNPEIGGSTLVHNIFVQCGSELGYSGLIVFIWMILGCLFVTRKVRKLARLEDDSFLTVIAYGLDCALIGFLVSGSFVTVLYYPYFWIHCALVSCLYTAMMKKKGLLE